MTRNTVIRITILGLVSAVLLSLFQIAKRVILETTNKTVEITINYDDLRNLNFLMKTNLDKLFFLFKKAGVISLVVTQNELGQNLKEIQSLKTDLIIKLDIKEKLDFKRISDGSTVMFANNEVFDFKTVEEKKLKVCLIEFYAPKGFDKIPVENVITLHTIKDEEIDMYTPKKLERRYLRACFERKIKVLYFKFKFNSKDMLQENIQVISNVTRGLVKAGFNTGKVKKNIYITGTNKFILLKQITAFLIAIIFPVYGFYISKEMRQVILRFFLITFFSLSGGILISGLLNDSVFLTNIKQFMGTKAALLLPVIIIFIYLFSQVKGVLKQKELLFFVFSVLLIMSGIIIIRSGNFNVPLFPFESNIRDFFEEIFAVRPRIKEFLIGHPFLIFGLYFYSKAKEDKEKLIGIFFISIGLIGQTSLINTFCHMHIPFLLSCLRSLYGVILGILGGYALIICSKVLKKY